MQKKYKIIIFITLAVIMAAAGAYCVYRKKNEDKIGQDKITDNLADIAQQTDKFPLRYNPYVQYEEVKHLQKYLNNLNDKTGYTLNNLKVDGYFGKNTLGASQVLLGLQEISEDYYNRVITKTI